MLDISLAAPIPNSQNKGFNTIQKNMVPPEFEWHQSSENSDIFNILFFFSSLIHAAIDYCGIGLTLLLFVCS